MKETYLHIKLVRPFVGYLTLRLAWPESFAPDALMVSSQGDVVFDLARRETQRRLAGIAQAATTPTTGISMMAAE